MVNIIFTILDKFFNDNILFLGEIKLKRIYLFILEYTRIYTFFPNGLHYITQNILGMLSNKNNLVFKFIYQC